MYFRATLLALFVCLIGWNSPLFGSEGSEEADSPKQSTAQSDDSEFGRRIPDFVLPDSNGKQTALTDFEDVRVFVVVFVGTECPIGNSYVPDLNDLQKRYSDRNVQVIGINSNLSDSAKSIAKHAKEYKITFPILVDDDQLAADIGEGSDQGLVGNVRACGQGGRRHVSLLFAGPSCTRHAEYAAELRRLHSQTGCQAPFGPVIRTAAPVSAPAAARYARASRLTGRR